MLTAIPTVAPPYCGPSISDSISAARWLLDHRADPDLKHDFGGSGHGGEQLPCIWLPNTGP